MAGLAVNFDCATVLSNDLLGDGQTQPAAGRFRVDVGSAVEALEDARQILGRDAPTMIAYAQQGIVGMVVVDYSDTDLDTGPLRTVLDRVIDQIGEHSRQA